MARSLRSLADRLEEGAAASAAPDLDQQTLAQLQALGYMAGPGEEDARSYDPSRPRTDPKVKFHLHRMLMLAQSRVSGGEEEEATRLLRRALDEDPDLLDAHQLLGDIELDAESFAAAAGHFERALALDDRHKPSLFGLATSHLRLGKTDEALLGYRRLLDVAGQDSKATLAIADIEVERGELGAAEETLRRRGAAGSPGAAVQSTGGSASPGRTADRGATELRTSD